MSLRSPAEREQATGAHDQRREYERERDDSRMPCTEAARIGRRTEAGVQRLPPQAAGARTVEPELRAWQPREVVARRPRPGIAVKESQRPRMASLDGWPGESPFAG